MISKSSILLWASIGLNCLFIILGVTIIASKGGIKYISTKFNEMNKSVMHSDKKELNNFYQTDHYFRRNEYFQALPTTSSDILMVGNSLTEQGDWSELLGNASVKNRGISGDIVLGVLNRIEEHIQQKPKKLFLMIGTNDIWRGEKKPENIVNQYRQILTIIQEMSPNTIIYVQSLLPINNQNFLVSIDNSTIELVNQELKQLAEEFSITYLDIYPELINNENLLNADFTGDGVHLNALGYLQWAKTISPYIND